MAASLHTPRTGGSCYWPRSFLYVSSPRPLPPLLRGALHELTAEVAWMAPGEALLDITHSQRRYGPPERIAALVERLAADLPVTIGVAATPAVARHAASGPARGARVIAPWESRGQLENVPLARLCGANRRLAAALRAGGLHTCNDLLRLPREAVLRRFGPAGRELWLAVQGRDPAVVERDIAPLDRASASRVLPPRTLSLRTLERYLAHLCQRLATRLRRLDLHAGRLEIRLRHADAGADIEAAVALPHGAVPDAQRMALLACAEFRRQWQGGAIARIDLAAAGLANASGQLELFSAAEIAALDPAYGHGPVSGFGFGTPGSAGSRFGAGFHRSTPDWKPAA